MEGDPLLTSLDNTSHRRPTLKLITIKCVSSVSLLVLSVIAIILTIWRFNANPSFIASSANNPMKHIKQNSVDHEIRNGEDAKGSDFPWIASWRFKSGGHCCTGSLIHQNPPIILTADHCMGCKTDGGVDVGRTYTEKKDKKDIYDSFQISDVIGHPKYDVAMVILKGTTSRPIIPLADPTSDGADMVPAGTEMHIMGYGAIDQKDQIDSFCLQKASIKYWSKQDCYKQLKNECRCGSSWNGDEMLCGWDFHESTEAGDSGGPAVISSYLAGVNSWSPYKCDDKRILDIFVDVGSVRHWIEDNKPTTESYIVGLHVCDTHTVDERLIKQGRKTRLKTDLGSSLGIILFGENGKSEVLGLRDVKSENEFHIFRFDIDNIGWQVASIGFVPLDDDSLCFDFVIAGQLDTPQLFSGMATPFWVSGNSMQKIDLVNTCSHNNYQSILAVIDDDNNQSEKKSNKKSKKSSKKSSSKSNKASPTPSPIQLPPPIDTNWYTVIIHICDETLAASDTSFYARLNADYGRTEWIEFGTDGLDKDGLYIFYVDAQKDIGSIVETVDITAIGSDATCIDMVTAGQASQPDKWRGSTEEFWMDNPCSDDVPIDECYEYHSLSLACYQ